jgi:hypothetical protein
VYDLQELCFENLVMWGQFWEKFMFFYTWTIARTGPGGLTQSFSGIQWHRYQKWKWVWHWKS